MKLTDDLVCSGLSDLEALLLGAQQLVDRAARRAVVGGLLEGRVDARGQESFVRFIRELVAIGRGLKSDVEHHLAGRTVSQLQESEVELLQEKLDAVHQALLMLQEALTIFGGHEKQRLASRISDA